MLRNYIKIALRSFFRFRVYSLINLLGLAMGLTISVSILFFVTDQLAFDHLLRSAFKPLKPA